MYLFSFITGYRRPATIFIFSGWFVLYEEKQNRLKKAQSLLSVRRWKYLFTYTPQDSPRSAEIDEKRIYGGPGGLDKY